jgi:ribosome-associated protein
VTVAGPDREGTRPGGLRVAPGIVIPVVELSWRFTSSGGPGGQHVNTSNTRAEVIFDVAGSPSLPGWARERLLARLGPSVAVAASDRRSQARNRGLALSRLAAKLAAALETEPSRRPTRPTLASQKRRLDAKRRRSGVKRDRRDDGRDGD